MINQHTLDYHATNFNTFCRWLCLTNQSPSKTSLTLAVTLAGTQTVTLYHVTWKHVIKSVFAVYLHQWRVLTLSLYTRYPIVARRAWPAGCIGRVRRASKGILHTNSVHCRVILERVIKCDWQILTRYNRAKYNFTFISARDRTAWAVFSALFYIREMHLR